MTAKETVQALYAAYATGDPDRIAALLHPDVIWVAPAGNATQIALGLGSPDDAGPPRGLNDLDRDHVTLHHRCSRTSMFETPLLRAARARPF